MSGGDIERVTLWRCPECGVSSRGAFKECGGYAATKHDYIDTQEVVFVRADQVVRELERLAADFEGAMEVALDREYPDLANAYEIAAAKTLTLATQLQGETNA